MDTCLFFPVYLHMRFEFRYEIKEGSPQGTLKLAPLKKTTSEILFFILEVDFGIWNRHNLFKSVNVGIPTRCVT